MRLQRLCLIALALAAALLTTVSARAEADDLPTAVLGLETQDVAPKMADEIADQLRQSVSSSHDMRLVSGRDLVELKLVFSCADEAHTCMAQAGKSLSVERLIYGSVKRSGDSFVVWLKLFDVKREKIESWLSETVPKEKMVGAPLKANVVRWFSKLRGRSTDVGTLRITSEVSGAVVALDGVAAGATSEQALTLSDIPSGKHEISLSKMGYRSSSQSVSIAPGQVVDLKLALGDGPDGGSNSNRKPVVQVAEAEAEDDRKAAGKDQSRPSSRGRSRGSVYRNAFWVTLGAGVISAAGALKYGVDINKVNQDLDGYRRYPCAAGTCDSEGLPKPALTGEEKEAAAALTDKGIDSMPCNGCASVSGLRWESPVDIFFTKDTWPATPLTVRGVSRRQHAGVRNGALESFPPPVRQAVVSWPSSIFEEPVRQPKQ